MDWLLSRKILFYAIFIIFLLNSFDVLFVQADNGVCEKQQSDITSLLSNSFTKQKFLSRFVFTDDSKPGLQITWAGLDSKIVIAITLASSATKSALADVYRSTDDGRSFSRITEQISPGKPLLLLSQLGLQRHPGNSSQLFLACSGPSETSTDLYMSRDGGATWVLTVLPFALTEAFIFHETQPHLALARSGYSLFLTQDGGISWTRLKDRVVKAAWGSATDAPNALYIVHDAAVQTSESPDSAPSVIRDAGSSSSRVPRSTRSLMKTVDLGDNWLSLVENIYSYVGRANFLFVSLGEPDGQSRRLEVSSDYGASFNRTSLPLIRPDTFASLMDVAHGLAFVYIDSGSLNGYGTLYTSDASGCLYSKSLERHFYPPGIVASDFYRVESMPGTYLTTVLRKDSGSMATMITHNRGAVWEPLTAPIGAGGCPATGCQLQLVSEYNIAKGQVAELPLSLASAPGLLIAHGHVGGSIDVATEQNVYVSSNGGHSWSLALNGPHKVQIGNNGGFIAAVPIGGSSPRLIKFSTDAGRCWHTAEFANEEYRFTGFVSEPGSRATSVAIWGYSDTSRHWRIFAIDFAAILTRQCSQSDYEPWLANGALANTGASSNSSRGCVFGAKETIMRLKADSMCANSYSYEPSKTIEPCECTKSDFGCEFGYMRELSGRDCVKDPSVAELTVCTDANVVKRILTDGYRKLPGNRCMGGFSPNITQQRALQGENCSQLLHRQQLAAEAAASAELRARAEDAARLVARLNAADAEAAAENRRRLLSIVLPVCGVLSGLLILVLALVLAAKLRERRRRLAAFHYSVVSAANRAEDAAGGVDGGGGGGVGGFSAASPTTSQRFAKSAVSLMSPKRTGRAADKQTLLTASVEDETEVAAAAPAAGDSAIA